MSDGLTRVRVEFGAFLKAWREAQGWSIRTFEDWHREAPGLFRFNVGNSTWNKIENGTGPSPSVKSFISLGEMNAALAARRYGTVHSRKLKDQLARTEPIRESNGRVWEAGDFFDAFVGAAELPWDGIGRALAGASN